MMRRLVGMFLILPMVLSAANPKPAAPVAAAVAINQLGWMAGRWRLERAGRVVEEQWMAPAGGVMLGMSRTITRGKVSEFEFMQIREGPGGALFFVALPSGQKETAFQVLTFGPNGAVFENLQHDFPQRISYTLQADGSLLAAIEGPGEEGKVRRVEFPYKRIQP